MSSVLDDINKRRTRQSVGEQPAAAPVEPVAPVAQPMGDQANARVAQGAMPQAESGFNPTAEQKATAMMLVNPALTTPAEPAAPKQMTYTDLHKELYKPMTPEEKEAQQKRQRNRQIINAVGDGISALANLYYTNKSGVNAYDPSTSLTKAAKERYDKLLAQQREDEERYKELAYRSGAADLEMAYRRAKDAAAEKRADKAAEDAAEARRLAQENATQTQKNWEKQFEAEQAHKAEVLKLKKQVNADNTKIRKEANRIREKYQDEKVIQKMTNDFYGKPKQHGVDGPLIYDRVWQHSWPEVFKVMKAAGVGKGTKGDFLYNQQFDNMTSQEKQNWVDEHFKEVPEAVAMMEELAKNTPESFRATQTKSEDDGVIDYVPGGAEEEIIDYVPNN